MKHNHPTTESLNIEIGGIYSFVNKYNYVTIFKVSRVSEKSVYVFSLLSDGTFSTRESREGVTSFKKYTLQSKF